MKMRPSKRLLLSSIAEMNLSRPRLSLPDRRSNERRSYYAPRPLIVFPEKRERERRKSETVLSGYIAEFQKQATHPPGKDPSLAAFYHALSSITMKSWSARQYLTNIITQREFTPYHFANLFFRSIQYTELFLEKNATYPHGLITQDAWERELSHLLEYAGDEIGELLLTKDTTTTIYQRYAGTKAVVNSLFPNQPLAIADFGCGGNHGLPGLEKDIPFNDIVDMTPEQWVTKQIQHNVNLREGLAVDRVNPYTADARQWRRACSFYPQELTKIDDLNSLEAKLIDPDHIRFLQGDLLALSPLLSDGRLPSSYFDAGVLSTVCYQMKPAEQRKVFANAKQAIKENGVLIVQDFAKKHSRNPDMLDFNVDWGEPGSYRTFISQSSIDNGAWQEVLQWDNGRCKEVRVGEDFGVLAQMKPSVSIASDLSA